MFVYDPFYYSPFFDALNTGGGRVGRSLQCHSLRRCSAFCSPSEFHTPEFSEVNRGARLQRDERFIMYNYVLYEL